MGLLVGLLLGNTAFAVFLNEQSGEFTSALASHDSGRYWTSIYKTIGLIAAAAPFYVFYYFVRDKLVNYWRRWLTHNFLDTYFRNNAFYKLAFKWVGILIFQHEHSMVLIPSIVGSEVDVPLSIHRMQFGCPNALAARAAGSWPPDNL